MSLGKRLKMLRDNMGYTKEDVASKLAVSLSLVEKWERDERRPTLDKAEKLSILYGMTVDEMIGDTIFNDDQRLKAAEVARILAKNDKEKIEQLKQILSTAGYNEEQIKHFLKMASVLFRPPK